MNPASLVSTAPARGSTALPRVTAALLRELNESVGHWTGELSSSALSTAVATIALGELDRSAGTRHHGHLVESGLRWLAGHVNPDGGWGDTLRSRSNLSTTALVWAAFGAAGADAHHATVVERAASWIQRATGSIERLVPAIEEAYGSDRTFSVPIVMTLALSGRLGSDGWRWARPLPFELALFPQSLFGALRLPVVSYALPALIAIGQTIHHHAPTRNPITGMLRNLARRPTLRTLEGLQPVNGGFLEATPLTAFVTMSLAGLGLGDHIVAQRGAAFLRGSMRSDGSWPIDTNLATWVTTLAIKALAHQTGAISNTQQERLRDWLLGQQYRSVHPYTGAAPGGWAWTDLPGGVPDADDTAGALLALKHLGEPDAPTFRAAQDGVGWLLDLQNRDGGMPTFCRGWGTLPFDRSTPEITAHAMRAWVAWRPLLDARQGGRIEAALPRAFRFLERSQQENGSWIPLWFGNEQTTRQENPVYGTAQVLTALDRLAGAGENVLTRARDRAINFLLSAQNFDGGWGGDAHAPSSIEETSLALEALAGVEAAVPAVRRAARLLEESLGSGSEGGGGASPVGLYFARLWYFERLYPLIFATGALGRLASSEDR